MYVKMHVLSDALLRCSPPPPPHPTPSWPQPCSGAESAERRTNPTLSPETGRCGAEGQGQEIKGLHGEINSISITEIALCTSQAC